VEVIAPTTSNIPRPKGSRADQRRKRCPNVCFLGRCGPAALFCVAPLWTTRDARKEVGGPAIATPTATGFGTELIRACVQALSGNIDKKFAPTGLDCSIVLTLRTARPKNRTSDVRFCPKQTSFVALHMSAFWVKLTTAAAGLLQQVTA